MALVRPFRALRYDPSRVDPSRVVAPALDVVTEERRAAHIAREPRSILSLLADVPTLTEAENERRHAFMLGDLRRAGILVEDPEPALFVLRESFTNRDGEKESRVGFFAEIDEARGGRILPHEGTLDETARRAHRPKEPINLVFEDTNGRVMRTIGAEITERDPDMKATLGNLTLELFVIDDDTACARVETLLEDQDLLIADGHHRYSWHDGDGPFPAFLSSKNDLGNRLSALHRIIDLAGFRRDHFLDHASAFFYVEELTASADYKSLLREGVRPRAVLVDKRGLTLLTLKEGAPLDDVENLPEDDTVRGIAAAVMPIIVMDHLLRVDASTPVRYHGSGTAVIDAVANASGSSSVGLILPPPPFDAVLEAAKRGVCVPPKTTCFHPKVSNGVLVAQW